MTESSHVVYFFLDKMKYIRKGVPLNRESDKALHRHSLIRAEITNDYCCEGLEQQ